MPHTHRPAPWPATSLALCLVAAGCSSETDPEISGPTTTTSSSATGGSTSTGGEGGSGGTGGSGTGDYCSACFDPSAQGSLQDAELDSTSGLAASRRHSNVYYAHNDEGDTPRFFATNLLGEALGSYELAGATHVDWEDCAVGPCPDGDCLYLADIGDNNHSRAEYAVYRVTEPDSVGAGTHQVSFERFPFQYPDGSHDANTLLVHPDSGELVVIATVFANPSPAYRFPLPLEADQLVTLEAIGGVELPSGSPELSGADVHHGGVGLLLLSRTSLFFAPLTAGSIADSLGGTLCAMPRASESQGEAVAWTAPGDGYATISEGQGSAFSFVTCTPQ